jgi:hypothetical protein
MRSRFLSLFVNNVTIYRERSVKCKCGTHTEFHGEIRRVIQTNNVCHEIALF